MLPFWLSVCFLTPLVTGTGHFVNPSGTDGAFTFKEGDRIDLSWTGIADYPIFSVGYFSTTNQTITWLIANSLEHPTSYTWTIDASEQGFDLDSSQLFALYACNWTNFDSPFMSPYFTINAAASGSGDDTTSTLKSILTQSNTLTNTRTTQTSTTTTKSSTASDVRSTYTPPSRASASASNSFFSSTTSSLPSATTTADALSTSSSGMAVGAKAGIGVGAAFACVVIISVGFFTIRHMRSSSREHGAAGPPFHSGTTNTSSPTTFSPVGSGGTLSPCATTDWSQGYPTHIGGPYYQQQQQQQQLQPQGMHQVQTPLSGYSGQSWHPPDHKPPFSTIVTSTAYEVPASDRTRRPAAAELGATGVPRDRGRAELGP